MHNRVLSSQDKGIQKSRIVACLVYISLMRDEGCVFLYFENKGGIGENEAVYNVNGKKMFTLKGRERNGLKKILSKHDLATGSILKIYFLKRLLVEISLQESALETCVLIGTSCSSSQDPKPQKTRRRRR